MPAKQYGCLEDFHTRVDDKTGAEKFFEAGQDYDGPPERIDVLLTGFARPLIAAKPDSKEN